MSESPTSNPLGEFTARLSPGAQRVQPPSPEVEKKQDPGHTEGQFARDLEKATRRKPDSS